MKSIPVSEGFIPFRGYHTFYRVVGDLAWSSSGKLPLLALHGSPPSHEVLEPLEKITETGRPVIFYDQLGCGRSDRPDDPALWKIGLYVDELDAVRQALHLENLHLLGHSWGGVVVMEYALRKPSGLASLILASTIVSRAMLDADWERLKKELPAEVYETLRQHEQAGTTDDPAYQRASRVIDLTHVCRVDPWPEYFDRALEHRPVGKVDMSGWDIRGRLNEIRVPTLVTCGKYDCTTPAHPEIIHQGIRGSEFILFEESSHYAHVEETDRYLAVLDEFITRKEQTAVLKV